MSLPEIAGRVRDQALRTLWRYRQPDVKTLARDDRVAGYRPRPTLPPASGAPAVAKLHLVEAADRILRGKWQVFAHLHPRLGSDPDWFIDARSGQRAPSGEFSFDIRYRDESRIGNIKYIWEPSRHHHLTVLAAAYDLTGDDRYALRIAEHLKSWWSENQFLSGPHWISGIEIGIRLISWAWIRQLLAAWPGVSALFEDNEAFITQLYAHQLWLARFPSRGSSANNHLVAEAAGQVVAACAFPFFGASTRWRVDAADTLRREAVAQTFPCGSNRELATDYHGFVLELLLAAAIQSDLAGFPLDDTVWDAMCRMTDVVAAMLDDAGNAPRQGDADDGIGLLLDDPAYDRWQSLLATGARLFTPLSWWPQVRDEDVRTFLLTANIKARGGSYVRPSSRPDVFPDAGQVFLRSAKQGVWCRCDHGPHGFGSIAAHAHADALSIEVRVGSVEIFADPGTYCYHGDPKWRDYFRSTFAHNTLELFGRDQSASGGPFLWTRHALSRLVAAKGLEEDCDEASWVAEHSGYAEQGPVHRRAVSLQRAGNSVRVEDILIGDGFGSAPGRLCWHLGPSVLCRLDGARAELSWPGGRARLELPRQLAWKTEAGNDNPPAGWYSPSFDRKIPATTLVGSGVISPGAALVTELRLSKEASAE
jgi:hypothetical protein